MSFSRFLYKLGRFFVLALLFMVLVLLIPAGVVFIIVIGVQSEIYIAPALLIPMLLAVYSFPINWFLGHACGAQFYNTGYVRDGNSVFAMVRDEAYYKRAIIVDFSIMASLVFSSIYFSVIMSFNFTWGMVGLVQSIVGVFFYFLLAMSAIEKSGIKNKAKKDFAEDFKKKEPIKKEQRTKFNFDSYPEMLEMYNQYKYYKYSAVRLKYDETSKELYKDHCAKRDELFPVLVKQVYDIFNSKKPTLINKKTKEKIEWDKLFDKPFGSLTQKQKDIMIKLLDASPYYFENKNFYN